MVIVALSAVPHYLMEVRVLQQPGNVLFLACVSSAFALAPGLRQLSVAHFLDFNPKQWHLTGIYLF